MTVTDATTTDNLVESRIVIHDTAYFSEDYANYRLGRQANGSYVVTHIADQTLDTLSNSVKNLKFADLEGPIGRFYSDSFGENAIKNGSFETIVPYKAYGTYGIHQLITSGWSVFDSIPHWSSPIGIIEVHSLSFNTGNITHNRVVELDSTTNSKIFTAVTLAQAGEYVFSLDYAMRSWDTGTNGFVVAIDDVVVKTIRPQLYGFKQLEFSVTLSEGAHAISITGAGNSDGTGTVVDNISLIKNDPFTLGDNLLVNGDFETHDSLTNIHWGIVNSVNGWTANVGAFEIQTGDFGTKNTIGNSVLSLDSNVNSSVSQTINVLDPGTFMISFDYALRSLYGGALIESRSIETNGLAVSLDYETIRQIIPNSQGFFSSSIKVNLDAGAHKLQFTALGTSDGIGTVIDNVSLRKMTFAVLGDEILTNGSFGEHLGSLSNVSWGIMNSIPGWEATVGHIEIQTKNFNTGNTDGNAVVSLDAYKNSTIKQNFTVDSKGTFVLSFDYSMQAIRVSHDANLLSISTNGLSVSIDNKLIEEIRPQSQDLKQAMFTVSLDAGAHSITFSGIGTSDGIGSIIDNVSLRESLSAPAPAASAAAFAPRSAIVPVIDTDDTTVDYTSITSSPNASNDTYSGYHYEMASTTPAPQVIDGLDASDSDAESATSNAFYDDVTL